jgi:hypothetical protein
VVAVSCKGLGGMEARAAQGGGAGEMLLEAGIIGTAHTARHLPLRVFGYFTLGWPWVTTSDEHLPFMAGA